MWESHCVGLTVCVSTVCASQSDWRCSASSASLRSGTFIDLQLPRPREQHSVRNRTDPDAGLDRSLNIWAGNLQTRDRALDIRAGNLQTCDRPSTFGDETCRPAIGPSAFGDHPPAPLFTEKPTPLTSARTRNKTPPFSPRNANKLHYPGYWLAKSGIKGLPGSPLDTFTFLHYRFGSRPKPGAAELPTYFPVTNPPQRPV